MISLPILKQTLKSNYKLWLIFTALLCVLGSVMIAVYDPQTMNSMIKMMKDMPGAERFNDERLSGLTTLLGMLGSQFYQMLGVILPMIFIIITANSLIASQVDRGSMAYLLSTPTKRCTVVRTQGLYMALSVFAMFAVVAISGVTTAELVHGGVIGKAYPKDVKAVAELLDKENDVIADDLSIILTNPEALSLGAEERKVDEDVYTVYLSMKLAEGVEAEPQLQPAMSPEQATEMQNKLTEGVEAAAEVLNEDFADLITDMGSIKESQAALDAAVAASGIPHEMFIGIINSQLAENLINADAGIDFKLDKYLLLNLGCFLLMFAISGISFMFSCIFNLSKNSLALGAGIPIAFFIFQVMSQIGDSLENFKYLSLNTLFDTNAITSGGDFVWKLVVLGVLGIVLYVTGMKCFKEKDLPL